MNPTDSGRCIREDATDPLTDRQPGTRHSPCLSTRPRTDQSLVHSAWCSARSLESPRGFVGNNQGHHVFTEQATENALLVLQAMIL